MVSTRAGPALTASAALLLGVAGALHAQEIDVGSRVRITTGTERLQGELAGMVGDSMLVRPDGYHAVRALCTCDFLSLEASEGRRQRWLPYGAIGALVGAVAAEPLLDSGLLDDPGFLLSGLAVASAVFLYPFYSPISEEHRPELAGGVLGAALGVWTGLATAGDLWRPLEDPRTWRLLVAPDPEAGIRIGVRLGGF